MDSTQPLKKEQEMIVMGKDNLHLHTTGELTIKEITLASLLNQTIMYFRTKMEKIH